MDAVTAWDHSLRCRHPLQLQLPLPLSQIPFCSSRSQWICNGCAGCWIRDEGRQAFKTAERSGSASNAGCEAGYNTVLWVCLWASSGCWRATTACTRHGGWCKHCLALCSGWCYCDTLSGICHARLVHRRWEGGLLTRLCRGYGTPSLRGIPLASHRRNGSFTRGKLRIPRRPTFLLFLNNSYDRSSASVRTLERHIPI